MNAWLRQLSPTEQVAALRQRIAALPASRATEIQSIWDSQGYYAAMTRTDAVVMTAGIGENSAELRERIFAGLAHMGMILDHERNDVTGQIGVNRIISIDDSPIKICVVTTDEEVRIARETDNLVGQLNE